MSDFLNFLNKVLRSQIQIDQQLVRHATLRSLAQSCKEVSENIASENGIDFSLGIIFFFSFHSHVQRPIFLKPGRGRGVGGRDAWPCKGRVL